MQTPGWKDEDVNSNSGRTEDSLISSKTSRETVNSVKNRKQRIAKYCQHKVRRQYCQYKFLISSILLTTFGTLQIIFPPYEVLLGIRVRMTPGLPPFNLWLDPPDQVVAKVYIFNVTNSVEFLNGKDEKIKLQEIGPIIYREKLLHSNPIFNENGTLTYTSNRSLIYLPERNPTFLLNQTITMPNIAVLFIPSYFHDPSFMVRFGINLMIRRLNSTMFKTATIDEFLWNMTDPILDVSQTIAPNLVPIKNVGILSKIYQNFVDNITVFIGPKYEQRDFFKINKVDGSEYMPLRRSCEDKIEGSTEGVAYFQRINKNDTLKYFRKTICKIVDLKYTGEISKYGINGYRFEMDPRFYERTNESIKQDCYKGDPILPNGLIDVSPCHYDTSVAASNPHFLYGDVNLINSVEGLNPDPKLHTSFVEVEPATGVPLQGQAKSQLNIVIKNMKGFNDRLHKFSNLNIPLFWIEYNQEGLPEKIQWLLYLQVIVLPILQKVFVVLTFVVALFLFILYIKRRRKCSRNLEKNKTHAFESESFLKN